MWNNSSSRPIKVPLCKIVPRWTMWYQDAEHFPNLTRLPSLPSPHRIPRLLRFLLGDQQHPVQRGTPHLGQQGGQHEDRLDVQQGELINILLFDMIIMWVCSNTIRHCLCMYYTIHYNTEVPPRGPQRNQQTSPRSNQHAVQLINQHFGLVL